ALCDLVRRPVLGPTVSGLTPPGGGIAEGATFSGRGTLTGSEEPFDGIVTAIEPDRFIGFAFRYGNGARLQEQWRLSPTPSGTLINYHAELSLPGGLFGKLLDRVMAGSGFRRQREAVLAHVKARL